MICTCDISGCGRDATYHITELDGTKHFCEEHAAAYLRSVEDQYDQKDDTQTFEQVAA